MRAGLPSPRATATASATPAVTLSKPFAHRPDPVSRALFRYALPKMSGLPARGLRSPLLRHSHHNPSRSPFTMNMRPAMSLLCWRSLQWSGVRVNGPQASTIAEWLTLADQHEAATRAIYGVPVAWGQCIFHLGLTVECLMKARIMQRGRFNTWPTRPMRRDLYTHDLRALAILADMPADPLDAIAPALHIVLQWDRNQGYGHRPPRRAVVDGFMEAAFGPEGVATWLRRTLP